MKNENNNKKTDFSISKINNIIGKLNKTGILLIVVLYIVVLGVILSFVGKEINYVNTPNYEHEFYDEEITPQISLVGVRKFDEDGQSLKYNVSVSISGRPIDGKDPNYTISNFRMFANTKSKVDDKEPNATYYFTEHTSYKTQVTHSFTMDNSEKGQHPSEFYVRLQYEDKKGETKVSTFKEDVFLQPTTNDIAKMQNWYDENTNSENLKHPSAASIHNAKGDQIGVFQMAAYKVTDENSEPEGKYNAGVRIDLTKLPESTKKFHVDMQSWIITVDKDGHEKYLPFIGVYNYTGSSKKYTNSYTAIDYKLKPKYLCAKLLFQEKEDGTITECYFKQDINSINDTFSSEPDVGVDAGDIKNNNRVLYITLAATISVVVAIALIVGVYFYTKKTSKKEPENDEESLENNEEKDSKEN